LAELRSLDCHPTADELHARLRKRLPRLSLGTVYRNLELMSDHGMILKLSTAGKQKRFDGNTTPHHHLRCAECDRVFDLHDLKHGADLDRLLGKVLQETGCHAYQLELTGKCRECRTQELKEEEVYNVG